MTITVDGLGNGSGADSSTSTIANAELDATGHDVQATEGEATGSVLVASFTDANSAAINTDFTATIDWGDGSGTDSGTIAWNSNTNQFDVTAPTHTYLHAGTKNLTVTINGLGGGVVQATPDADVANQTITVTATSFNGAIEGETTGPVVVANFTDANAAAVAGDFTATIDWGDNSGPDSDVSIVPDGNGSFNVIGNHLYAHAGEAQVSVEVDGAGGGSNSDSTLDSIANQTITASATTFSGVEGEDVAGTTIGSFTDANSLASANDFGVSIDWGDGSGLDTQTGAITEISGTFFVSGDHTYAHAGTYNPTFTITGAGGGGDQATSEADIANAAMDGSANDFTATEGTATSSQVIASFTDANALASAGDFNATINWATAAARIADRSRGMQTRTNSSDDPGAALRSCRPEDGDGYDRR